MNERSQRILVVDDELGMRDGCRRILAAEGYEVSVAENGALALEAFRAAGGFDVVVTDLKMPVMGGMELVEQIHALDEDAVLLVITAYATIDTAVDATKRGAYGYVPKPFSPDELLLHVRNGLEKRALRLEGKQLRQERERRLLEVAFERSKSRTILNCMTDGVLVVNRNAQLVLRNQAAARILPECAEQALPAAASEVVAEPLVVELLEQAARSESPMIASREMPHGESTYMVNAAPVIDATGERLGAVAVLRDITAMKKLETAKSLFISMVAHEVKSPLAAIESLLGAVLDGANDHDTERDQAMIRRALVRAGGLRGMIADLLNLTAIETGHFQMTRVKTDLADIVRDIVESYQDRAGQRHIDLSLESDNHAPTEPILGDPTALRSIVQNLVDNAIKYTPEGGHVKVRIDDSGVFARVSVKDDGIGMSPHEKAHVFDEFYRVKNDFTASVSGTGLGLTLVQRLIKMHDGRIDVDSAPGQGTTFTVLLPHASCAAAV